MDIDTRSNLRIVEPASPALVTPADIRAQFSSDEATLIAAATEDVVGDLAAMSARLEDLPPDLQRRLIRSRTFWRVLVLDANPAASEAGSDHQRLLDAVDLFVAFNQQQPAPKRRKARSDA